MNEKEEKKKRRREEKRREHQNQNIFPPSHSLVRVYDDEKEGKKEQSSREKERSRNKAGKTRTNREMRFTTVL